MRFGIVVSDPGDWTAHAMRASFTRQGADALFLDFSELEALIDQELCLSSNGIDLLDLDGLIIRDLGRRGSHDVAFRFETLQALVEYGYSIINPPQAIARAANKFATSLALSRAGVPTPKTLITTSPRQAAKALEIFGKAVSKPLFGYKGKGIFLLQQEIEDDRARLEKIVEQNGLIYLQEFIASTAPRDIRAFVVDGRILGAIYRVAPPGQWISNLARGGRAEPCPITPELEDLALRANRAVGTVYSGVDLLETRDGLKVIEVNGTPSGKGIYEALGMDVTAYIASRTMHLRGSQ